MLQVTRKEQTTTKRTNTWINKLLNKYYKEVPELWFSSRVSSEYYSTTSDHYDSDEIQWCLITCFRYITEVLRVLTSLIKGSNLFTRWPQMVKICSVFMCLYIHFSLAVFIWRIQWFPESKCPQTRHDLFFVFRLYILWRSC